MNVPTIVAELRMAGVRQEEQRRANDYARRELAASVLEDGGYPKIADMIRAGMRSSTWPENLAIIYLTQQSP